MRNPYKSILCNFQKFGTEYFTMNDMGNLFKNILCILQNCKLKLSVIKFNKLRVSTSHRHVKTTTSQKYFLKVSKN